MRFSDVAAIGLLALPLSVFAETPSAQLFSGRILSPAADPASVRKEVKTWYASIDPSLSVLIYDCSLPGWCDEPSFSFRTVFGKAAAIGRKDVDRALTEWYTSGEDPSFQRFFASPNKPWSTSSPPFQLLAVVNRLDLASWDSGRKKWTGAEARFVYGLAPPDGASTTSDFTLIVEFVLPEVTWQQMRAAAAAWQGVSPKAGLVKGIQAALATSGMPRSRYARVRINRTLGGSWKFDQWLFIPPANASQAARPLAPTPLDNQIQVGFVEGTLSSNPLYSTYLMLWNAPQPVTSLTVDPRLYASSDQCRDQSNHGVCYTKGYSPIDNPKTEMLGMPTPTGVCGASPQVRNVVALQQCAYCHSDAETGTEFAHIGNHMRAQPAKLSAFLTGRKPGAAPDPVEKPSLDQLFSASTATNAAKEKFFDVVTVTYPTWKIGAGGTCQQAMGTSDRRFHDLARRALFLAAVLAAPDQFDAGWLAQIQQFSSNFSD